VCNVYSKGSLTIRQQELSEVSKGPYIRWAMGSALFTYVVITGHINIAALINAALINTALMALTSTLRKLVPHMKHKWQTWSLLQLEHSPILVTIPN